MLNYIYDLYKHELETGRLEFESDPGYRKALGGFTQHYEAVWQAGDHKRCETLYSSCFDLVHYSSRAAFLRGLRLGMGLMCWGMAGPSEL